MNAFANAIPRFVKVTIDGETFSVRRRHPYLRAMRCLARTAQKTKLRKVPRRHDTKQLWEHLDDPKKTMLHFLERHPLHKMTQVELQHALNVDSLGLRVIHGSLARICQARGFERPVRSTGYSSENRSYVMDDDVAASVRDCWRRDHP